MDNLTNATCLSLNQKGVLIMGPAQSGKSSLAMALYVANHMNGALVTDRNIWLTLHNFSQHEKEIIAFNPKATGILTIGPQFYALPYTTKMRIDVVIEIEHTQPMPSPITLTHKEILSHNLPCIQVPQLINGGLQPVLDNLIGNNYLAAVQ